MDLNLHRRQLSASQRAMVATRYATIKNGGDRGVNQHGEWQTAKMRTAIEGAVEQTAEAAAVRVGVSTRMIEHAKKLVREAPPAVVRLVEAGELTISGAQDVIEFATPTELAAIDENLIRKQLNAAEEALAIHRRGELIASMDAEEKLKAEVEAGGSCGPIEPKLPPKAHRSTGVGRGAGGGRKPKPDAQHRVGTIRGVSQSTVHRALKRHEALGTETLERVVGTTLAKPGELDALASLPPIEREVIVTRAHRVIVPL